MLTSHVSDRRYRPTNSAAFAKLCSPPNGRRRRCNRLDSKSEYLEAAMFESVESRLRK